MALTFIVAGCKDKERQVAELAIETIAMAVGYELRDSFVWTPEADSYYQAIMEGKMSLDGAQAAEGYLRTQTHPLIANRLVRLAEMVGFNLDAGSIVGVDKVDMGLLKVAAQGFRMGMLLDAPVKAGYDFSEAAKLTSMQLGQ